MAEKSDEFAEVKKLLDSIQQDVAGGEYVYRGTPKIHRWNKEVDKKADKERINSSIFRKNRKRIDFGEHYQPANIESEIIEAAHSHFLPHTSNLEILSDLRHFGGDTTLIDFSSDLLVALFFACSDKFRTEGELIAFPTAEAKQDIDDYFKDNGTKKESLPKEISLLPPARTQANKARVIAQKSVFIHVPEGFIPANLCKIITIERELKKPILAYLKHFHDIDETAIYPDLHGFIATQSRFASPLMRFYAGNALLKKDMPKEAIKEYTKAIRLNPEFAEAYFNRGIAKVKLHRSKEAIYDFDEVIRLKPDYASAYFERGVEKTFVNRLEEGINDLDEAIRLKPDYAKAYFYRGMAKAKLNSFEEAIKDYDKAIRFKPDYASAYFERGLAKVESNRLEEAIEDFTEAIRLNRDDFDFYHSRGEAWQKLGNKEKAQADFDKEEELASKQPEKENN